MNWSEPKPPKEGVSLYDYVYVDTPLGEISIFWKGWKENPAYEITLSYDEECEEWIGCEYSLEEAKETARKWLEEKKNELIMYMDSM